MRARADARGVIPLLAVAGGASVANVYFAQPLLVTIGRDLGMAPALVGAVVTLTHVGYGLGLFLLVPLGDMKDRRRLIVTQLVLLAGALAVVSVAPTAALLLVGMAAVGLLAVVTQTLVVHAASLAPPARRGRVVGQVTGGVVIGILLARAVSGLLADLAGWRSVYLASAGLTALLALVLSRSLPRSPGGAAPPALGYGRLLRSTVDLFARERLLRVRALLGLLIFAAFSTLWSSVALPLSEAPHSLSHTAIGAFGLIGAVGALAAGAAGRLNDRGLSRWTTGSRPGAARRLLGAAGVHRQLAVGTGRRGGRPGPRRAGGARHQSDPDLRAASRGGRPADRRIHDLLRDRQRHRRPRRHFSVRGGRVGRRMCTGCRDQRSRLSGVGARNTRPAHSARSLR